MPSFQITGGIGGLMKLTCNHCGGELEREPETGNFRCSKPGCGQGHLSSAGGIEASLSDDGNVLLTGGKKPS